MGRCWAAIILQWSKHRIGIDLVAGTGQEPATIIAADVIAARCDRGQLCNLKVDSRYSSLQDRIPDVQDSPLKHGDVCGSIFAERAACNRNASCSTGCVVIYAAPNKRRRIAAQRTVADGEIGRSTAAVVCNSAAGGRGVPIERAVDDNQAG